MSTRRLSMTIWILSCLVLWAGFARDPLTIVLCAVFTLPHTVYLLRRSRVRSVPRALA